jgi:hypothetical protein
MRAYFANVSDIKSRATLDHAMQPMHVYEVRSRKDKRCVESNQRCAAIRAVVLDRIITLLKPGRIQHNSR